ncbi:hypothetical protein EX011_21685 [Salmonella enterica]|nr:hypothetical protein [Salmonella enterica]
MIPGLFLMLVGLVILGFNQAHNRAQLKAQIADYKARMGFINSLARRGDLSTMETIRQVSQETE